ncbi:MAG: hypothetical protein A3I10_00575 [Deltaproteobacteria bacterium RIFCSPLOWO2_02_FULL_57_26]|nr:MAG: hypothetical protein A3I10_00575 [Deltaproteobacteria bacterium RIFCSPLOWO2_02_FULL_57_26]
MDAFISKRFPKGPIDHLMLLHQAFPFKGGRNYQDLKVISTSSEILNLNGRARQGFLQCRLYFIRADHFKLRILTLMASFKAPQG